MTETYEFTECTVSPDHGYCLGEGHDTANPPVYANARNTADTWSNNTGQWYFGQYWDPDSGVYGRFQVMRGGISWVVDAGYTGPANPTITQAQIAVKIKIDNSIVDFDLQLCRADWSAYQPCTLWTVENVFDMVRDATNEVDILNSSGKAVDTWYSSPNFADLTYLNAFTFNTNDKIFYGLRSKEDYNNSEPTDFERLQLYIGASGVFTNYPKLKIWYEAAGNTFVSNVQLGSRATEGTFTNDLMLGTVPTDGTFTKGVRLE